MNIKQGDIGLLVALDALLEEENVSLAARRIGVSQPAMSTQLKRLRHLFNDPLLTPSGRRLVATSRAQSLRDELKHHLQGLNAIVRDNQSFDPATTSETFRLIGTDYVQAILAPKLEADIRSVAPAARLAFIAFEPKTLWQSLEDEMADLALATGMRLADAIGQPAISEDFQVIQRKHHPRGTRKFSFDEFCAYRHVLVSPEGGGFVGATDKTLQTMGYAREVTVSVPSFLLAIPLVAQSDALCLLPTRLAKRHTDVVDCFAPPFKSPEFKVDMLWHPRRQADPAHVWFRNRVRELCKKV